MLSRVALALFSVGRLIEHAEHVARLVDVNVSVILDRPGADASQRWRQIARLSGAGDRFDARSLGDNIKQAGGFLAVDGDNPNSAYASIVAAREHARSVRESISSEAWEQLNRLYWQVTGDAPNWFRNPHEYFQKVKIGCHLLHGIIDETMDHDEGWHFLLLGKALERLGNTVRLVATARRLLAERDIEEPSEWAAVLRSCSAFEAYRQSGAGPVRPLGVVQFLLFQPLFPRSALYCAIQVADLVEWIGPGTTSSGQPDRLVGRLAGQTRAALEFADPATILTPEGAGLLDRLLGRCAELESAIPAVYFLGGRFDPGAAVVDVPHQQQQ